MPSHHKHDHHADHAMVYSDEIEDKIDSISDALQKRYQHLTELAASQPVRQEKTLYQHSPIRALVSHVFG